MKVGRGNISIASLFVLVIQLGLVSAVAAKYLYQRSTCPRVWTRIVAIDPEMPMRGRYLSLRLMVDGCQSTLPSAKQAAFPRNLDGTVKPAPYVLMGSPAFPAKLAVEKGRLVALRDPVVEVHSSDQMVIALPGISCEAMQVARPVSFYIADKAASPLPLGAGQELWIEVTLPPNGPPRPIQLALKQNGVWKPLILK